MCPRKHSLEVTQEEVQDEELMTGERDYTVLQSVEETACEPPAITRVRPVEQGCLKRPISRKMSRQESVEELDKEKLKSKMVVKRQDWSERRESLQKQDALREPDSSSLCGDDRDESFLARAQNKSSLDSGTLEAKATSTTLKDMLYKKLNTRVSEGIAEPSGGSSESEGGLRSTLCSIHPERQHCRQGKDSVKPDRLDFKAPNIEFTRKRLSFEEREDCICRCSSSIHENLHFGSTRSKSLQLDTAMPHDHMKAGLGGVLSSPEGLAPKLFSGRGESAVEKLQLISSAESSLRKTSSEYKLEGRQVSSLRPLEGTLDIGLLSGPRVSKTETCLSKMADNTIDTVSANPPIWLQTPTERQITIPQLKTADKLKSPLTCSLSPEAVSSISSIVSSKDQSSDQKISTSGEKTQERHSESLKAQTGRAEVPSFTVKQESRTSMKAGSPLAHEHRGPRHCHFSSCGKTPSIREVSNEDQEDEMEPQDVTLQSAVVSLTSAKLDKGIKTVETPSAATQPSPVLLQQSVSCGLDTGQRQSCEKKAATAQISNMPSASTVQNNSASARAPENVLEKQQLANICSPKTEPQLTVTRATSAPAHENKTCSVKSEGQDRSERSVSKESVQSNRSAVEMVAHPGSSGSKKEVNTCVTAAKPEQKRDVPAVNTVTSSNNVSEVKLGVNKKDKTVSTGAVESGSMSLQKKEDPISPKIKVVKVSEQPLKNHPTERAQHKLPDSDCYISKKAEPVISVKEKQNCSPSLTENHLSPKSKSKLDSQPVAHGVSKTEKETKTVEVKSHSPTPHVPALKGSPSSKQREPSKESTLLTSNQVNHESKGKEASLSCAGVDAKREESQLTNSPTVTDMKQKETQPKSSVATSVHLMKENTDSKPKPLPSPKTAPSSSTLKTSVAPPLIKQSPDGKHKDLSHKNQAPPLKNHNDPKPKHVASPQHPLPSDVPSQSSLPAALPKPAEKTETHLSAGRISSCAPQEAVGKVTKESPKSDTLKADSHRGPDMRVTTPEKQASSSKKEQAERKKRETVQEVTSAQRNTKRDASRAAPSAHKDTSDKDSGRCKQKESPRSLANKK